MKYLHKFENSADFNTAYNGSDYHEPWVSYTLVTDNGKPKVNYNKKMAVTEFTVDMSNLNITIQNAGVTCEDLTSEKSGNTYPGLLHIINASGCDDATFEGEFQYDEYSMNWAFSFETENECYMFGTIHMSCNNGEIEMIIPS